jgi:uncharacterized membrane protein
MNRKYITQQLFSGLLLIGCGAKDDTGVVDTSTTDTSTTDTSTTDTSTTDTSTTDTSTTGTVTPVEPDFYGLGTTSGLYARAVSADGSYIVGWVSSGHTEAFILSEAGTVMLGDIEGGRDRSIPYAVSSDGSVVVGVGAYGDGSQDDEGVVWNQMDSSILGIGLLSGGIRSGLTGLSDDGTVAVGHGNTSSLSSEAFLWTETSGVVLLGGLS